MGTLPTSWNFLSKLPMTDPLRLVGESSLDCGVTSPFSRPNAAAKTILELETGHCNACVYARTDVVCGKGVEMTFCFHVHQVLKMLVINVGEEH